MRSKTRTRRPDKGQGMHDPVLMSLLEQWQRALAEDRALATAQRYLGVVHRFLAWYADQEHPAPCAGSPHTNYPGELS